MADQDQDVEGERKCSGYKYPEECPCDGSFDPHSSDCAECIKDAMDAMNE